MYTMYIFQYVCVHIRTDQMMTFSGTEDPCALVNLMSIGKLGVKENKSHTAVLMEKIEGALGVPQDR
jgi:phenylpyruvate tautomerase